MASGALAGSRSPSPSASTPNRAHVLGMNCVHPTAPALDGPRLRPKSDSIFVSPARTAAPFGPREYRADAAEKIAARFGGAETAPPPRRRHAAWPFAPAAMSSHP